MGTSCLHQLGEFIGIGSDQFLIGDANDLVIFGFDAPLPLIAGRRKIACRNRVVARRLTPNTRRSSQHYLNHLGFDVALQIILPSLLQVEEIKHPLGSRRQDAFLANIDRQSLPTSHYSCTKRAKCLTSIRTKHPWDLCTVLVKERLFREFTLVAASADRHEIKRMHREERVFRLGQVVIDLGFSIDLCDSTTRTVTGRTRDELIRPRRIRDVKLVDQLETCQTAPTGHFLRNTIDNKAMVELAEYYFQG